MAKNLVYQTNREFDKCAMMLQKILNAQDKEPCRDAKFSVAHETNQKKKQASSINSRKKTQNSKVTVIKSSSPKTNINGNIEADVKRSSYLLNSVSHSTSKHTNEEPSMCKYHVNHNRFRKNAKCSPSPTENIHQCTIHSSKTDLLTNFKSQKKITPSSFHHHTRNREELQRSSSCSDLPSSKHNVIDEEDACFTLEQFITHLTNIQTISQHIRARNAGNVHGRAYNYLWNELETCLSSVLSLANNNKQVQVSLIPLQNEIIELRKQLQTTNIHLHRCDLTNHQKEQYVHLKNKFDTNQIQCSQLLLHNKELKIKCHALQNKIDNLEQNNILLMERINRKDLRSVEQRSQWFPQEDHFMLRKEINILKNKLYHAYDDLTTLFNRNHTLQIFIQEQNQQLLSYKQHIDHLKQSAQNLLHDLDYQSIEKKIKNFVNNLLLGHNSHRIWESSIRQTLTKPPSSTIVPSFKLLKTTCKVADISIVQSHKFRSLTSPPVKMNKLHPKSLFITPTILNDSAIVSKFQHYERPTRDTTDSLSSTINDADSTLISSCSISLCQQHQKCPTLSNSLPILSIPTTIDKTKIMTTILNQEQSNNYESSVEFDHISDLTSKMFSSGDEDMLVDDKSIITCSSSTKSSNIQKLIHI